MGLCFPLCVATQKIPWDHVEVGNEEVIQFNRRQFRTIDLGSRKQVQMKVLEEFWIAIARNYDSSERAPDVIQICSG